MEEPYGPGKDDTESTPVEATRLQTQFFCPDWLKSKLITKIFDKHNNSEKTQMNCNSYVNEKENL